jgi:hypothetical protein
LSPAVRAGHSPAFGSNERVLGHDRVEQVTHYEAVASFFSAARATRFAGIEARRCWVAEREQGRGEMREARSVDARAMPLPGAPWPSLRSVTLLECTRVLDGKGATERHFYLASLPPSVRRIAAAARAGGSRTNCTGSLMRRWGGRQHDS